MCLKALKTTVACRKDSHSSFITELLINIKKYIYTNYVSIKRGWKKWMRLCQAMKKNIFNKNDSFVGVREFFITHSP